MRSQFSFLKCLILTFGCLTMLALASAPAAPPVQAKVRVTANAEMEPLIREVCLRHGWRCPEICTPEQLLPKEEGETP